MGYTTEFIGEFKTDRPVDDTFFHYINTFAITRHMDRDEQKVKSCDPQWKEHGFMGNIGPHAMLYIPPKTLPKSMQNPDSPLNRFMIDSNFRDKDDLTVLNYNSPAPGVPSLWCQWIMSDHSTLEWNGGEKFYVYDQWLEFLIKNFFEPAGYSLNGYVHWRREDFDDIGTIAVKDNVMHVFQNEHLTPEEISQKIDGPAMLIRKLYDDAQIPTRGSAFAAGYDLYANNSERMTDDVIPIEAHETVRIGTGIAVKIPDGHFGGIFARSGLATKFGLRPANCTGVIDEDYTGELIVALHNDSDNVMAIEKGSRIAQLVLIPYTAVPLRETNVLPETKRGSGGFGSTGQK